MPHLEKKRKIRRRRNRGKIAHWRVYVSSQAIIGYPHTTQKAGLPVDVIVHRFRTPPHKAPGLLSAGQWKKIEKDEGSKDLPPGQEKKDKEESG